MLLDEFRAPVPDGQVGNLWVRGDSALAYGVPAWTDDSLLNTNDLTTQAGNAKYESFLSLPVTTLRAWLAS